MKNTRNCWRCAAIVAAGCSMSMGAKADQPSADGGRTASSAEEPSAGASQPAQPHVRVTLVSEFASVQAGHEAQFGLLFSIDRGWHIYWNGFTTSGVPPTVEWTLPEGATMSEIEWPVPKRYLPDPEIVDHIYENRVLLMFKVRAPESLTPGEWLTVKGKVSYLVCREACIGEEADVHLDLPVTQTTPAGNPRYAKDFSVTRMRLPRAFPTDGSIRVIWSKSGAALRAPQALRAVFYPGADCYELANIHETAGSAERLMVRASPDADPKAPLSGVLEVLAANGTTEFYSVKSERPAAATGSTVSPGSTPGQVPNATGADGAR